MAHRSAEGRQFGLLKVLDDFNCEGLGIEPGFSLPAARVVRASLRLARASDGNDTNGRGTTPVRRKTFDILDLNQARSFLGELA